eukprot:COSAG06_NODE_52038_length_308_cov_0.775120_1_plen_55_part_10
MMRREVAAGSSYMLLLARPRQRHPPLGAPREATAHQLNPTPRSPQQPACAPGREA